MHDTIQLREVLDPLLSTLAGGRYFRLIARPGLVVVDRAEASATAAVVWDNERHDSALRALGDAVVRFDNGVTAARVADTVVLHHPPDPLRRIDDLSRDGRISSLAGRLLSASLSLGKNVLLVGADCVAMDLMAALLAESKRPALVAPESLALPAAWLRVRSLEQAKQVGADRIGIWSYDPSVLAPWLLNGNGLLAWCDARRLDRALMRFEAQLYSLGVEGNAAVPLHVLSALDLIVVVGDRGGPKVLEIAEIAMTEDGYRPELLFSTNVSAMLAALVPLAVPSFQDELLQAGFKLLVDELSHAVPDRAPRFSLSEPQSEPQSEPRRAAPRPAKARRKLAASPVISVEPQSRQAREDAPPPGWELDMVSEEGVENEPPQNSNDDAVMAATYGLAPPPRPSGVRASAGRVFADVLQEQSPTSVGLADDDESEV